MKEQKIHNHLADLTDLERRVCNSSLMSSEKELTLLASIAQAKSTALLALATVKEKEED
ncbi:hypothetical protein D3C71_1560500 [compost metagenome]